MEPYPKPYLDTPCSSFSSFLDASFLIAIVLPALLQKLVGGFFLILRREIMREILAGILRDFSDPQKKAQNLRGEFLSVLLEKFKPDQGRANHEVQTVN